MKKLIIFSAILISGTVLTSANLPEKVVTVETITESMKIVNDTDNEVKIHTGTGVVTLTKGGGSTSISCEVGKKIYTAPNGSKKDLIFEVDASMCGKTVKLSAYL